GGITPTPTGELMDWLANVSWGGAELLGGPGVERVAPALERRLALRGVPVHEGAQEHRVRVAAHLVLDDEERLARRRIHDRLEPVLDLAALLGDEAELVQLRVWAGEVRDVDRDVMAVVGRLRRRRLAEDQLLSTAELHARGDALGVGRDRGGRAHDRLVEARDPRGAAGRHRELDAGHPERHVAEPGAGGEAAQPVPPRAGDGH